MSLIAEINVVDEISPLLAYYLETHKRLISTLGKSVGYLYRQTIKGEIPEGHAGSVEYPERWSLELRRKLDKKAPKQFYGRIRSAVGYEYENGVTKVGWLSKSSARIGRLQEEGYHKYVTKRMRGYFRSVGINLRSQTTILNIPSRPIYTPIADELRPQIAPYMEKKLQEYMDKGKPKASRRVYKVY